MSCDVSLHGAAAALADRPLSVLPQRPAALMRCRSVLTSFFAFAFFTLPVRTLDNSQATPVVLTVLVGRDRDLGFGDGLALTAA
jgi:hypothetical protein